MDSGSVKVRIQIGEPFYYEVLSEVTGENITSEYDLIRTVKELSALRKRIRGSKRCYGGCPFKRIRSCFSTKEEIKLEDPIIIKQSNTKF